MGKYNGWTNYETWAVNLWLSNDESSYNGVLRLADEMWEDAEFEDGPFTRKEHAARLLSDQLKTDVDNGSPIQTGMYADLLKAALSEVNWYEIAERYLEKYAEEEAATA